MDPRGLAQMEKGLYRQSSGVLLGLGGTPQALCKPAKETMSSPVGRSRGGQGRQSVQETDMQGVAAL